MIGVLIGLMYNYETTHFDPDPRRICSHQHSWYADAACCSAVHSWLIVPFPAGGGADVLARSMLTPWTRTWTDVWTANHPGAGGTLGAQYLSRQHPDGGYVGYVTNGILCVNPLLYPKTPFDPMASLEPVDESLRLVSLPCSILMPLKV